MPRAASFALVPSASALRTAGAVAAMAAGMGTTIACLVISRPALACAPVSGGESRVAIAGEQALIVWEPARKREHFIRSATFDTAADSFGFLVPVPALPEIAEVDDELIGNIDAFIEAQRREEIAYRVVAGSWFFGMMRSASPGGPELAAPGVDVLSTARVAGMDAVVLAADSAQALVDWLARHHFQNRPDLGPWLAPYVAAHYKICAFKYAPAAAAGQVTSVQPPAAVPGSAPAPPLPAPGRNVSSRAVRISFTTDRPYFPYREPADAVRTGTHTLRVLLVAPWRASGTLAPPDASGGGGANPSYVPWPATTRFAGPLSGVSLGFASVQGAWLTELIDTSPQRPTAGDLFFAPSSDDAAAEPPPSHREVTIPIPVAELALVVAGIAIGIWYRRRRHRG